MSCCGPAGLERRLAEPPAPWAAMPNNFVEGERQRDVFPLPALPFSGCPAPGAVCRGVRQRRVRAGSTIGWANSCIGELNACAGFGNFSQLPATAQQSRCLQHILSCFRDAGPPVPDAGGDEEALRALLASSAAYDADSSPVRAYAKELVSWPAAGHRAAPLLERVRPADNE